MSENSFWVNIDWLQGYAAFSFGPVFCIFRNVSWEEALASTKTQHESLFNPEWCSTVFGSWPSKTLGRWALSQGEKERKRARKERKRERERGLHRRPTSPSPVPAMKDYVSFAFIFCSLHHPPSISLSLSLSVALSPIGHTRYQ